MAGRSVIDLRCLRLVPDLRWGVRVVRQAEPDDRAAVIVSVAAFAEDPAWSFLLEDAL